MYTQVIGQKSAHFLWNKYLTTITKTFNHRRHIKGKRFPGLLSDFIFIVPPQPWQIRGSTSKTARINAAQLKGHFLLFGVSDSGLPEIITIIYYYITIIAIILNIITVLKIYLIRYNFINRIKGNVNRHLNMVTKNWIMPIKTV
jgi:hypothetical protein